MTRLATPPRQPAAAGGTADASVAALVLAQAAAAPLRPALVFADRWASGDRVVSYGSLARDAGAFAAGLRGSGLTAGAPVAVLAPPMADLYALVLGLWAAGHPVVIADPALGRAGVLDALDRAGVAAVISTLRALRWWPLLPALHRRRRFAVDGAAWGVAPVAALRGDPADPRATPVHRAPGDSALLSFTSGSTGRPKAVDRTHGVLGAQHDALERLAPLAPGAVHHSTFPAAVIHNLCCGATSLVGRPGAGPAETLAALARWNASVLSGAPAQLVALAEVAGGRAARWVRQLAVGGAPVFAGDARRILAAFPDADARLVYGATEAEPMASAELREAADDAGPGVLAGDPLLELLAARLPDMPPTPFDVRGAAAALHEPGEVVVRGPQVVTRYPIHEAAEGALLVGGDDVAPWLRTGDVGSLDARGCLRLLGRRTELVPHAGGVLHPYEVERVALECAAVRGAALVAQHGAAVLAVEATADGAAGVQARLERAGIGDVDVRVVARIPRDRRYASKVDRRRLRATLGRAEG